MGTRADFYLDRGVEAIWLGSLEWDGYPEGIPENILNATNPEAFKVNVETYLEGRGDGILAENGWPWTWSDSQSTGYAYAFDGGKVWASFYGSSWWTPPLEEPDHRTLTAKAAVFPDMSMRKKIAVDETRSGRIYIKPSKHP